LAAYIIFYLIFFFLYREEIYCDNKTESAIAGGNEIPAAVRSGEQMDMIGKTSSTADQIICSLRTRSSPVYPSSVHAANQSILLQSRTKPNILKQPCHNQLILLQSMLKPT
jgi:hypothetical protein